MIKEFSALRFVLILMIFFHHMPGVEYDGGGSLVVSAFFILSGFCMVLGYKDYVLSPQFKYFWYLKNRLIKFYPLHWLCLFLILLGKTVAEYNIKDFAVLFINAGLLQSFFPIKTIYFSYNAPSWYLCNTVFATVVFPYMYRCLKNKKGYLFPAFFFLAYFILCAIIPESYRHAILYVNPVVRISDFLVGILLAELFTNIGSIQKWSDHHIQLLRILSCLSFCVMLILSLILPERYALISCVYWIPTSMLILSIALISPRTKTLLSNSVLVRLGESSFVFYMIHFIVIWKLQKLFEILHFDNVCYRAIVTLFIVTSLSVVINRYLYVPLTKWAKKLCC